MQNIIIMPQAAFKCSLRPISWVKRIGGFRAKRVKRVNVSCSACLSVAGLDWNRGFNPVGRWPWAVSRPAGEGPPAVARHGKGSRGRRVLEAVLHGLSARALGLSAPSGFAGQGLLFHGNRQASSCRTLGGLWPPCSPDMPVFVGLGLRGAIPLVMSAGMRMPGSRSVQRDLFKRNYPFTSESEGTDKNGGGKIGKRI